MISTILVVFALVLSVVAAGAPAGVEPYRLRFFAAAFACYMASLLPLFR
jgi:hypothetical protein